MTVVDEMRRQERARAYAEMVDAENDYLIHHGAAMRARRAEMEARLERLEQGIARDAAGLPAAPFVPITAAEKQAALEREKDRVRAAYQAAKAKAKPAPRPAVTRTPARERISYRAFDPITGKLYGS